MLRDPISCNKNCNTNNLYEYDPYGFDDNGNCIIDLTWWKSLTDYTKDLITERVDNKFTLTDITVPHKVYKDNKDKKLLTIYQSYIDGFDYNIWYNSNIPDGPKNTIIIPISNILKDILLNCHQTNSMDYNKELTDFKKIITNSIKPNQQYFIRLSGTSGKNEKSVRPFINVTDIIKHITSVKLFADQEYKRDKITCLILIPWNEQIDSRYEFRIFVVNNKLTAISSQFIELFQYSAEELDTIEYALSNIQFLNNTPYNTFIGDTYIDMDTKTCHLIELNPFGAHCGAGSALFNWAVDYDILYGKTDTVKFRYMSVINY